jgi:hypothetical protein
VLKPERGVDEDLAYGHRFADDSQVQLTLCNVNVYDNLYSTTVPLSTAGTGFIDPAYLAKRRGSWTPSSIKPRMSPNQFAAHRPTPPTSGHRRPNCSVSLRDRSTSITRSPHAKREKAAMMHHRSNLLRRRCAALTQCVRRSRLGQRTTTAPESGTALTSLMTPLRSASGPRRRRSLPHR